MYASGTSHPQSNCSNIPIICYAEDWGRLPSSTQHIMRQLSKTHPILWVDSLGLRTPSASGGDFNRIFSKIKKSFSGIREIEPNIYVLSPLVIPLYKFGLIRWINKQILRCYIKPFLWKRGFGTFLQWSSCPSSAIMCGALREIANIYYIGDEFSEFTQLNSNLVKNLENKLMMNSDLMLVVSDKLKKNKSKFNHLTFKIPHGCDFEHFSKTSGLNKNDIPEDLAKIKGPIIGYYGLIRDWFDFDLLRDTFSKNPDWSLVLIGPLDTDTSKIDNLPNVYFLGPKPYEFLPNYLRGFDICLIPYRRIEITINANPLKLLEYFASGKPVITTDLPSVYPYKEGLNIVKSTDELNITIGEILDDNALQLNKTGIELASKNSWLSRAKVIESLFEKHIYHLVRPAKKTVVMHLIAAMEIGGAEKVILNLLSQKDKGQYDLRVTSFVRAADGIGTKFLKTVSDTGIINDSIPIYKRFNIRDIFAMKKILKRHNVRLLHTHGYKSDIIGIMAARMFGIPAIVTAHGYINEGPSLKRYEKLGRLSLRFAQKTISVSDNVHQSLLNSGINENRIISIPNVVDFEYFAEKGEIDFREKWNVDKNEIIIGSAGRLSSEKAHINLINAFRLLPDRLQAKCRLVIAGNGPQKEELIAAANKHQLEKRFILTGFISDMRSFYKAIDIFCLPSLTEGMPLTILEAAASRKPIIASEVGSIGDLIKDSSDGFLATPGDINGLAKALERLLESDEQRKTFAIKLYNKLKTTYDIKGWANKIFDVYREILDR